MLISPERPLAMQKMNEIKRNLRATVNALPRWGGRISEVDRDLLIQALADLELLYTIIVEETNKETVYAAAREKEASKT